MDTERYTFDWSVGHWRNNRENKKFLKTNKNENTTYQNLWNATKVVLRRKLITINAHIKKPEISNNLMIHLKVLQKQEWANSTIKNKE
jgi:hypothetical protein